MVKMQNEEQIWADDVLPLLQTKAMKLAELISAKERFLKKAPAGRLRISKRGDHEQWFRTILRNVESISLWKTSAWREIWHKRITTGKFCRN